MPHLEIHTTDRTSFKRCRQRWDFSSNLRLNLEPATVIEPLWFGIGAHLALAEYYHPDTPRDIDNGIQVFSGYVNEWLDSQGGQWGAGEQSVEWAREMLTLGEGILQHYGIWAPAHDDFTVIWVEKSFEVQVPGMPGVSYSFRVDGLVQDEHDRIWILENKTAAQLYEQEEWLSLDDQCGSYLWGLTQLDPPIYAEGVIYNTLRKKVPKPLRQLVSGGFSVNKSQDTTFELALETLREEYGKVPRHYWEFLDHLKYQPNKFFKRTMVRRNRRELDLLGTELRNEVLDMVNNPPIYRSPSRMNCQGCPFIAPCIVKWEGGDIEFLLQQNYRKRNNGN